MEDYGMGAGRGVPSVMNTKLCDWAGLTLGGDLDGVPPPAAVASKGRGRAMVQPHFVASTPLSAGPTAGSGKPLGAAPVSQPAPVIPAVSSIQAPGVSTTHAPQPSPAAPTGSSSGWASGQGWGYASAGGWAGQAQPDYSHFG